MWSHHRPGRFALTILTRFPRIEISRPIFRAPGVVQLGAVSRAFLIQSHYRIGQTCEEEKEGKYYFFSHSMYTVIMLVVFI